MNPRYRKAAIKTGYIVLIGIIVLAGAVGAYYYSIITTPKPKVKIAVVSDTGGRGDLAFNDMAFKGGADAEKDFDVNMTVLISSTEADYIPNLETAAKDPEVKLIVGVGYLLSDALASVAPTHTDKFYVGIDTYAQSIIQSNDPGKYPLPNLMDIVFEEHKGSALAGALAALLAIQYQKPNIGTVLGMEIPTLWKFEIGYKWGADWAIEWYKTKFNTNEPPGIGATPKKERVLWTYTGSFGDVPKGYEAAKAMFAKDAVAVFNVAGLTGLGINQAVQEIAKDKSLTMGPPFMIGVDADQDWINPGFVIASMMKRVDKGVYYATKLVVNDKFTSAVKDNSGVITLGIGTKVAGEAMEGISLSSLTELDEFIKMGQDAEASTGKKVLPMSPDSIKSAVKSMRDGQPSWIWDAVNELQTKISNGTVTVPLVMTQDAVNQWRDTLG